jgi:probable HAF family extracellular repeat protein
MLPRKKSGSIRCFGVFKKGNPMHNSINLNTVFTALTLATGVVIAPATAKTILSLGTLGGPSSFARGLNEPGVVVGESVTSNGETHAFYYKPWERHMTDLGDLGGNYSLATAINNRGIAVGVSKKLPGDYCSKAVSWNTNRNGAVTVLPDIAPGSPYGCSEATAINDSGIIVGSSNSKAVRWVGGRIQALGALGDGNCFATGINARGWIVGQCNVASSFRAFIWKNGVMKDMGVPGTESFSVGGINAAGVAAGYGANAAGALSAFAWRNGTFTQLESLVTGKYANSRALSESGLFAGEANTAGDVIHAVWWDASRNIQDLGTLRKSTFSSAFAINSCGTIAGVSYVDTGVASTSGFRAVIWK